MRRSISTLAALLATMLAGFGLLSGAALAAPENQPQSPEQVARETVQTVLDRLNQHREEYRENPQALYQMIEEVLVPKVDVNYMSRLVLGRHWRDATPEQRERFAQAFKQMIIRNYGNALTGFDNEKIEYLPVRAPEGADDVTFRAMVTTDSGDKVQVSLDMHLVDGQWKVYNGNVGNLSFVTNYRGQFNAQIQRAGLETLIEKLESRYASAEGDS